MDLRLLILAPLLLFPLTSFSQIEARQDAYIKSSSFCPCLEDYFGFSVAISYPWAVVGHPKEDSDANGINGDSNNENDPGSGAAWVYFHDGSTWTEHSYLKASNPSIAFGTSVAIDGKTIVVGAESESSNATGVNGDQTDTSLIQAGAAYVFTRNSADVWSQQAYLKASNTSEGDISGSSGARFGSAVAISGDTIVVGAVGEKSFGTGVDGVQSNLNFFRAGAAYVFTRNSLGVWSQQVYLKASNTSDRDDFGSSVSIDGDILVIGAPTENSGGSGINPANIAESPDHTYAGAAYIYSRTGTAWTFRAHIKAPVAQASAYFGTSVSISGETIAIGAPNEDDSGRVHIYVRSGPNFIRQATLAPSLPSANQDFGQAVSLSGNNLLIGEDENAGSASLFRRRNTSAWTELTRFTPANPGAGDFFGSAVALDGFRALIGAHREDGVRNGVNAEVFDNANSDVGAVYAFSFTRALKIISATATDKSYLITFLGEPGLTSWELHGGSRFRFAVDYTAQTTFTEISPGRYLATLKNDFEMESKSFFRIELPE